MLCAGDEVERAETDENGKLTFTLDLPLGQYYVKEEQAPKGYVKSDEIFDVDASYQEDVEVIDIMAEFENTPIKVEISKTDITGEKELAGATLSVIDLEGNVIDTWVSTNETHMIERIPVDKYILREETAPYGYKIANDIEFEVTETKDIKKVQMKDEYAKGKIVIDKTDENTNNPLAGVTFELRDEEGNVIEVLAQVSFHNQEVLLKPLTLINEDKNKQSELAKRMKELEMKSPLGARHPAIKQYNKCMRGAGDTVRSIIISANSRLAFLENKQVLRLLPRDELNIAELGIGVNGDGNTKTALFCVIPDSDKSYNFIIGMLYTQVFQELYHQADFNYGGRLPIHVTFMLDEFANVALPDDYCSLLSTMRSREISSIIIIQNFAQLKALFKDTWETIPGNCDTFIYLGGNEQSTHKYVSELLGKGTIDKKSTGESRGRQGSSSRNFDVLGRELYTADEVRKLDNKKCIIFIRGFDPVLDDKYVPFVHPMFSQTADGGGVPYVHELNVNMRKIGPQYEILSENSLKYYEKMRDNGENVYIDCLKYEEFMSLGEFEMSKRFMQEDEQRQKEIFNNQEGQELEYMEDEMPENESVVKRKIDFEDGITNRMTHWDFNEKQVAAVKNAIKNKVKADVILESFYPEIAAEKMEELWNV